MLAVSDLAVVLACGALAYGLRLWTGGMLTPADYLELAPAALLFVAGLSVAGLYPGYGLGPVEELRRYAYVTSLVFLALVTATFLMKAGHLYSRGILLTAWALTTVALPATRALLRSLLSRTEWWGEPVVILGAGQTGHLVVRRLRANPGLGWRPVAVLDDDPSKWNTSMNGIPVLGGLELCTSLAAAGRISRAVLAIPGASWQRLADIVDRQARRFLRVSVVPDLFHLPSMWVSARDLQGILLLDIRSNLLDRRMRAVKRLAELLLALAVSVVALPVMALIVVAVKLDSPGPVLFGHERVGQGGRRFRALKFRTMVPNADSVLRESLARDAALRDEWAREHKLKNDPRITRVGRFLRRFSLDELPQLWNVLRGDMSLVGPRPIVADEAAKYGPAFDLYSRVRPGLTGLWQVSGRNDTSYEERVELDSYYIRNWSVWLDVYILMRTVTAVLSGKGAY
ncbi:undecaprenyl-phosphate galactose phosphotransferase WbaP [Carboxydochorda subterranea]|uniref:Undecaprenyl-phosphate galactose phosphotransferase WbaP n=1 Tax=Carboxydichorda subterranea TaxID=3109565 RepID=A0ABZ1C469_9FIRM|nr:undecaprenyl-phosphate galactose phosphotransferase WbaP [Limnochorda sp. L945t]WRP18847.1 undecaprenyl-phosphate galactose phosphotransferase WbaP [Limnochorda sp. L945t]